MEDCKDSKKCMICGKYLIYSSIEVFNMLTRCHGNVHRKCFDKNHLSSYLVDKGYWLRYYNIKMGEY